MEERKAVWRLEIQKKNEVQKILLARFNQNMEHFAAQKDQTRKDGRAEVEKCLEDVKIVYADEMYKKLIHKMTHEMQGLEMSAGGVTNYEYGDIDNYSFARQYKELFKDVQDWTENRSTKALKPKIENSIKKECEIEAKIAAQMKNIEELDLHLEQLKDDTDEEMLDQQFAGKTAKLAKMKEFTDAKKLRMAIMESEIQKMDKQIKHQARKLETLCSSTDIEDVEPLVLENLSIGAAGSSSQSKAFQSVRKIPMPDPDQFLSQPPRTDSVSNNVNESITQ